MIRSMTGYGHSSQNGYGYKVFIDVKSVNHRYSEVAVRMPKEWTCYEDRLKKATMQSIKRGRIDIFVTIERDASSDKSVSVDWALAEAYLSAADQLKQKFALTGEMTLREMIQFPDLFEIREVRPDTNEALGEMLDQCMSEALGQLNAMRLTEGQFLSSDLFGRLDRFDTYHSEVASLAPTVSKEYAEKLRNRLQELLQDQVPLDEQRIAMEVAVFADRSNIDEEITRLKSHMQQFRQLLRSDEPVGRKVDFLIQEMNREINTIGSKANHAELANLVIHMKAELEKMREQIQNIE
ncbi:YicC/YloC family endoribonuclease [Paenibacillus larvae]